MEGSRNKVTELQWQPLAIQYSLVRFVNAGCREYRSISGPDGHRFAHHLLRRGLYLGLLGAYRKASETV